MQVFLTVYLMVFANLFISRLVMTKPAMLEMFFSLDGVVCLCSTDVMAF
jgi:hypothetical protein